MQLFARKKSKGAISARHAQKQKNYACLECGGIVRVRSGLYRQPHFFHLSHNPNCRQSGKSFIHLQVQLHLEKQLPGAKLEHRFGPRIADVFWEDQKLVFEVQCSSITAQEIRERNRDYHNLGYQVVWILHDHRFNGKRATSAECFLQNYPHYFTNINSEGTGIIYDQVQWIQAGLRKKGHKQYTVDICYPMRPKKHSHRRLKHFPIYFRGDTIDNKVDAQSVQEIKLPSISLYQRIFQFLLKRACR